eukprot:CAMPEP_0180540796 /NCGR_PEP_ID=MMETSP1036_2-20121128/67601_1 /TAXON_ID=632150 /ORGANISM="Azadinium spinosum, Strain 3D9" /LENGTH=59 /DNA_ID=CAMNT_0022555603 /DNA_START=417 /DNA_END=593 /DNA_ORIENTATION=-
MKHWRRCEGEALCEGRIVDALIGPVAEEQERRENGHACTEAVSGHYDLPCRRLRQEIHK